MSLINKLAALSGTNVSTSNAVNNYLPISSSGNVIEYDYISGKILGMLIGREVDAKYYSFNEFKEKCIDELGGLLSDEDMLEHIETMYFSNNANALTCASPEFLLLKCIDIDQGTKESGKGSQKAASNKLSKIFGSMLALSEKRSELKSKANFIENIFLEILHGYLTKSDVKATGKEQIEKTYLPFIAEAFVKDIHYLSSKSEYMLEHFEQFLQLYNFLYCAQLALNIRNWTQGAPETKQLYFILDTEKASLERSQIREYGYTSLYRAFGSVFPILTMLYNFNKQGDGSVYPLWAYGDALRSDEYNVNEISTILAEYATKFQSEKDIYLRQADDNTPIAQMRLLVQYALDQFEPSRCSVIRTRHAVRNKYQKQFEDHVAKNFMQVRGRSGRVLVMNQDYLLLLTNLAIGPKRQLRFQELLKEFRARGVYFDKQSEQVLIAFFERVGNVDRMSDSGDAVYVRSTI